MEVKKNNRDSYIFYDTEALHEWFCVKHTDDGIKIYCSDRMNIETLGAKSIMLKINRD